MVGQYCRGGNDWEHPLEVARLDSARAYASSILLGNWTLRRVIEARQDEGEIPRHPIDDLFCEPALFIGKGALKTSVCVQWPADPNNSTHVPTKPRCHYIDVGLIRLTREYPYMDSENFETLPSFVAEVGSHGDPRDAYSVSQDLTFSITRIQGAAEVCINPYDGTLELPSHVSAYSVN